MSAKGCAMLNFNPHPSRTFLPSYKRKSTGICLKPQFFNEAIAESIVPQHYLSELDRSSYRVDLVQGKFYQTFQALNGAFLYILDVDNTMYCVPSYIGMNHSHLARGKPVKGAGM